MCNIFSYTCVHLLVLMSEMCHINAESLAKRMVDRLLQLLLKIALSLHLLKQRRQHCSQEIFRINQSKLVTTISVIVGQCDNVQNHILSV